MADTAVLPSLGSMPISRTRLIGREQERETARTLLLGDDVSPLLTLTGPGGVGKTRLAQAIATDAVGYFAGGVAWIDFAPRQDPALVPATLAHALGIMPAAGQPVVDQIVRRLRSQQVLLLIDNCEHLLAAVASLTAALLAHCPAVQVLATSRAPLHIRGEQVLAVEPLPLPPGGGNTREHLARNAAVRLFVERARAVHPSFTLTDANANTVAAICRKLDGLPLAIELAAARSAVLAPDVLLREMADRLQLPGDGPRDLSPRQQTIQATIAWSHNLLDPGAQALFRRLAVFLGGFTLEAARAVRPGGQSAEEAVSALAALVEQSLVRRDDGDDDPRFIMLETIRAFGLERLEDVGERDAARDAHAAHFVAWAARPPGRRPHGALPNDVVRRYALADGPNIRAALSRLIETGEADGVLRLATAFSLHVRLNPREGRTWFEWALAQTGANPTAPHGLALAELAFMHWSQGNHEQAIPLAEASHAIGLQLGDKDIIGLAVEVLGSVALSQHHYARARVFLGQAIHHWRRLGERLREASALQLLAGAEHGLGDEDAAERHAVEALAIYRDCPADEQWGGAASTLARLGRQARDLGNDRAAALAYHEALQLCADGVDRFILVQAYAGLGELASRRGQPETAAALIGAIDAIAEEAGATRLPTAGMNYDRAAAAALEALGAERFTGLRAAGRSLGLVDAVALARTVAIPAPAHGEPDPSWSLLDAGERSSPTADEHLAPDPGERGSCITAALRFTIALPDLTYREQDVLALLGQRMTDHEIAARLFISRKTASNHVSSILAKLGAANRRDAAATAARLGLI